MSTLTEDERAAAVVDRIVADLSDRRGLRQEWDEIDADIQSEIRETWHDIIVQELRR